MEWGAIAPGHSTEQSYKNILSLCRTLPVSKFLVILFANLHSHVFVVVCRVSRDCTHKQKFMSPVQSSSLLNICWEVFCYLCKPLRFTFAVRATRFVYCRWCVFMKCTDIVGCVRKYVVVGLLFTRTSLSFYSRVVILTADSQLVINNNTDHSHFCYK